MERTIIQTDNAPAAVGAYSQAVRLGNLVFTSGQIPLDTAGNLIDGDIKVQTKQVMENLKAVLEAAGTHYDNVVKCTCFLNDMEDFAGFNEVYGSYFSSPPARSAVEVARLPKDVLIEIEAIAFIPA